MVMLGKQHTTMLKALSGGLALLVIVLFVLAVLARMDWLWFWISAAIAAIFAYLILPRLTGQQRPRRP